jgi:hypothetical protein
MGKVCIADDLHKKFGKVVRFVTTRSLAPAAVLAAVGVTTRPVPGRKSFIAVVAGVVQNAGGR